MVRRIEARRPVVHVVGPAPSEGSARAGAVAAAERFRRNLGLSRQEVTRDDARATLVPEGEPMAPEDEAREQADQDPRGEASPQGEPETPQPGSGDDTPGGEGGREAQGSAEAAAPVQASAAAVPSHAVGAEPPVVPPPDEQVHQVANDPAFDFTRSAALLVVGLFVRADPAFQSWDVTVPLDAVTLPDSEVHVSLSPGWLRLRFRAGSAVSAALILSHRSRLQALLERQPSLPQSIDVDLD